ncbi:hypothetical protein K2Q00_03540 [Patescibacteria group bacterium]|nr:hypothetical protein [Patescibacteria group bacterium]
MAEAFDAAANALHDMADKMRMNPNGMLAKAFHPTVIGMDPALAAVFEIGYVPGDPQRVVVKGVTRVVQAELGFRAVWTASTEDGVTLGTIVPLPDNSFGG